MNRLTGGCDELAYATMEDAGFGGLSAGGATAFSTERRTSPTGGSTRSRTVSRDR